MNHNRRIIRVLTGVVFAVTALFGVLTVSATEFRTGDAIQITEGEILDDVFAAGGDIRIDAKIIGDVFAFGQAVTISDSARIDNSVMAAGRRVDLNGHIRNSARLAGEYITIRGHVERNFMGFGREIIIDGPGWVEKDANLGASEITIHGRLGGDLHASGGKITISGQIDGNVTIEGDQIVVQPSAIIGGKLKYISRQDAQIADGAQILNGVERMAAKIEVGGYSLAGFLWDAWWLLAAFFVGALLLALLRPFMDDTVAVMNTASIKTMGLGFLFLICIPVAGVVLVLSLVGSLAGILIIVVWMALLYMAKVFVGLAIGGMLLGRRGGARAWHAYLALFIGLVVIAIVVHIPYLGVLAQIIVASSGMGGFFLTVYERRTRAQAA